jgi:hypothetical protein
MRGRVPQSESSNQIRIKCDIVIFWWRVNVNRDLEWWVSLWGTLMYAWLHFAVHCYTHIPVPKLTLSLAVAWQRQPVVGVPLSLGFRTFLAISYQRLKQQIIDTERKQFNYGINSSTEIKVILQPAFSRIVSLNIRSPSGTRDQSFFRHLRFLYGSPLWREREWVFNLG